MRDTVVKYEDFTCSTREEILGCPHGIYKIFWESGGFSLAAIGSLPDGTRWMSPTNWTDSSTLKEHVLDIKYMQLLMAKRSS
jgi:hypothetical protein